MLSQLATADEQTIGMLVVAILVLSALLIADVLVEVMRLRERTKDRR